MARLLRLMMLIALALSPAGLVGAHAAPPAAAAAGHCAEMAGDAAGRPAHDPAAPRSIDCAIACACVPAAALRLGEGAATPRQRPAAVAAPARLAGSASGIDPPPPRAA